MGIQRRLQLAVAAAFGVVASCVPVLPARAVEKSIPIGVISPSGGGRSVRAGQGHESSIRMGLEHAGRVILAGGLSLKLKAIYKNDRGDPKMSVEMARELVEKHGVVAILGPVNSGCTKAVLAAELGVPVISSLSTSAELSEPRDPWFFRMTLDDRHRMKQLATHIRSHEELRSAVLLYEDDPFGRGLATALEDQLGRVVIVSRSWKEISASGAAGAENLQLLRDGRHFDPTFVQSLSPTPDGIFLLGTAEGSLALAHGLGVVLGERVSRSAVKLFFVGGTEQLVDEAPEGATTIADPVLDLRDAPDRAQFVELLDDFEKRFKQVRGDFFVTAYEAGRFVVPEAVRRVVARAGRVPAAKEFREQLRAVLDEGPFESLTPWRKIEFVDGDLAVPPTAPIYTIRRGFERLDLPDGQGWVRLEVPSSARFLEGPIEIRLEGRDIHRDRVSLTVRRVDEESEDMRSVVLPFAGGGATYQFNPPWPGRYRFETDVPFSPEQAEVVVSAGVTYLWALFGALVGAFLAVYAAREAGATIPHLRLPAGVLVGLMLAAVTFYRSAMPEWLPVPSFGENHLMNGMLAGLAGGWLGPAGLAMLLRPMKGLPSRPAEQKA